MKMRGKVLKGLCILFMVIVVLAGCQKSADNAVQRVESPETGLVFQISKEYLDQGTIMIEGPYKDYNENDTIQVVWYYTPITDKLFEEAKALSSEDLTVEKMEKLYEQMMTHSKYLMSITLIEEQKYKDAVDGGMELKDLAYGDNLEVLGTNEGYVYLLSIQENDTAGMEKEEKALYEECSAHMQSVKENLSFMKKTNTKKIPDKMPAFSAKDLEGNTVTDSIFGEKDLTVVNIWGTFCNPCVGEMPELGEWAKEMPENVQMVGLIVDINGEEDTEHQELAITITERAGAEFTQIIANEDFNEIMRWVTGVPTTLFVDKEGNIVGDPIVGANVKGYKNFVEEYINGK